MADPVVQVRDLSRRFGQRWAVARVDFELQPGERLLLMGENGSGKTTLLRILSTALRPSRGSLRVMGLDPTVDPEAVRKRLALLTHLPALYEDLSGPDNLRVLARLAGRPDRTEHWLEQVGLESRSDPVHTWSAGMRKRLSFARLLLQEPDLALIDEPYGQLDPEGFALVDDLLHTLARQGVSVIVASHMVERASQLCSRALLLHQGLPRWSGPASQAPLAWKVLHKGNSEEAPVVAP